MLGWGKASARRRAWGSDRIGKQLADYTERALYSDNGSKLRGFSDDWKQPIAEEIRGQIRVEILETVNPVLSCRSLIAAEALALGEIYALTLTEADGASLGYDNARLISCQLHQYIRACYPFVDEAGREYLRRFPDSDDGSLLSWANTQGAIRNYRLNAFNLVGCHFNDMVLRKDRDWLAPLVASATVWHEDRFAETRAAPNVR